MPKKSAEEMREKVVSMRKAGATYAMIERLVINPETGRPISRPTTIKILKEAGLTKPISPTAPVAAATATAPSKSVATPSATPSSSARASSPPVQVAASNGVDEFMPKTPKETKKAKPAPAAEPVEFECDSCGAEFTADSEEDLPDKCPECGN